MTVTSIRYTLRLLRQCKKMAVLFSNEVLASDNKKKKNHLITTNLARQTIVIRSSSPVEFPGAYIERSMYFSRTVSLKAAAVINI